MTEKRFFILTDVEYDIRPCIRDRLFEIKDIYGDYKYDDLEEICKTLNEQYETIQRLKDNIDELMKIDVEEDLLKENEQLKEEIKDLNDVLARYEEKELEND